MNSPMLWTLSHRADPSAGRIADRHYNRQKIGAQQFVPPGRCLVLLAKKALWVTSWPFAEFVKHDWAGAWINSLFRNEDPTQKSSELINQAVAATKMLWVPPPEGLITFVDPTQVPGITRRGERIFGYCYLKAGFEHVGFTQGKLWVWQLLPEKMPHAFPPKFNY